MSKYTSARCRHNTTSIFFLVLVFSIKSLAATAPEFEDSFESFPPSKLKWNMCQYTKGLSASVPGHLGQAESAIKIWSNADLNEPICDCLWRDQSRCIDSQGMNLLYQSDELESDIETQLLTLEADSVSLLDADTGVTVDCNSYDRARIPETRLVQKNELRLWKEDWAKANVGYWYSFQFKIQGEIDKCGSMRWVGGQFKAAGMDDSPFIAQRFDNGVFHVTIEALHHTILKRERIIVAKAEGNPDYFSRLQKGAKKDTKTCDMSKGVSRPDDCGFTGQVQPTGETLPSTMSGDWIRMDYYLKIEKQCNCDNPEDWPRILEIWANGKLISTVTGRFGALEAYDSLIKFKFGAYRDNQHGEAGIVFDHVTIRKDPDKEWSPKLRNVSGS
jgi:hypothetical protein